MLAPERTPLPAVFEDDVIGAMAIVRAGNIPRRVFQDFTAASFPPTPRNVVEGIDQHGVHPGDGFMRAGLAVVHINESAGMGIEDAHTPHPELSLLHPIS